MNQYASLAFWIWPRCLLAGVLLAASLPSGNACILAAEPEGQEAAGGDLRGQLAPLVEDLDSDRFDVRRRAAEEVENLLELSQSADACAAELRRLLNTREISFEVRTHIEAWLRQLPESPDAAEPVDVTDAELARWVARLDTDVYIDRLTASRRLESFARHPAVAGRLMLLLRDQLADPKLSLDLHARVLPLWERARGAWLLSDPSTWKLPPVPEAEWKQALADLIRPAPREHGAGVWREHAAARRLLLDLLARDEYLGPVKEAIQARLTSADVDFQAQGRLQELYDWTHPALVAEIWSGRRNLAIQHLLVDVARQAQGALRPSHFDRIDDKTAHCVSGSNLVPGDYPVGVAVPHPERISPPWMCHLINLPTPRRRMAYDYAAQVDEPQRLKELSERTMQRYIRERMHLSDLQIAYLQELDPQVVSRRIGEYFLAVDDQRLEPGAYNLGGLNASHHSRVASVLAQIGTHEVAPGLLTALQRDRFLAPVSSTSPYHWPWIAALSIAARDPWPDLDAWLASLIDRDDPLFVGLNVDDEEPGINDASDGPSPQHPPVLGAAAAALLLERHDLTPSAFGLEPQEYAVLRNIGCPSYRFESPDSRRRVKAWWRMQSQKSATP